MTASDNLRAAENAAPIHLFDEVDSTNDLALSAADRQALHGTCWAADHQTKGRGRREVGGGRRAWFSPRRANLYMSVLLRPALDEIGRASCRERVYVAHGAGARKSKGERQDRARYECE